MQKKADRNHDTYGKIKIPCFDPNSTITAPRYEISEDFIEEARRIEAKCKEFLRHAKPDQNNGSYMDAVIDTMVNKAIADLKHQRQEHKRLIKMPLSDMHKGDYTYVKREIKIRKKYLEEYKTELEMLNKILYEGTAFEKYK